MAMTGQLSLSCNVQRNQIAAKKLCVSTSSNLWLFFKFSAPTDRTSLRFLHGSSNERCSRPARTSLAARRLITSAIGNTVSTSSSPDKIGSFRGGQKRAEVERPALLLRVSCFELENESCQAFVDSLVAGGATIVLLEGDEGDAGGARLYEGACTLKSVLRGRAQLLVAERADIAAAAGADGVLLSDQGLPAVVARRMMEGASQTTQGLLPLVARKVQSLDAAVAATAAEGADLLVLETGQASLGELSSRISIPVVCQGAPPPADSHPLGDLGGGAGLALYVREVHEMLRGGGVDGRSYVAGLMAGMKQAMVAVKEGEEGVEEEEEEEGEVEVVEGVVAVPTDKNALDELALAIVGRERKLLGKLLDLLQQASPEMAETSLLEDALARLSDLFLLVIVGEFNAGKSSVVNALLGGPFLKEGVLPTTNEISVLRHVDEMRGAGGGEGAGGKPLERHPDGHFVRYLPAQLLKQMNLVDTPGTNVILERQQRLTEEFVPRADLVLFVLSADRPLTESEVSFLRYIRQWGKKVVFVLNKVDTLEGAQEIDEVSAFVRSNVRRLLGVDSAVCFPVSARQALKAKLASGGPGEESGFDALERFIRGFLEGSIDLGAERLRLKLDTPLGVGAALLAACERQLEGEVERARADKRSLKGVEGQVEARREGMEQEGALQRQRVAATLDESCKRAEAFVDRTLKLTNVTTIANYLVTPQVGRGGGMLPGSQQFESKVVGAALADIRAVLYEHQAWLASSVASQLSASCDVATARWPELATECAAQLPPHGQVAEAGGGTTAPGGTEGSLAALEGFDLKAAAMLLDEEMRSAVMSSFAGFGAAGVSAGVLTAILPSTVEDLLALALCTAGGYSNVLNLPQKREEVKVKLRRNVAGFKSHLTNCMQAELWVAKETVREGVLKILGPCEEEVNREVERVEALRERAEKLDGAMRELRQQVQNLGC